MKQFKLIKLNIQLLIFLLIKIISKKKYYFFQYYKTNLKDI